MFMSHLFRANDRNSELAVARTPRDLSLDFGLESGESQYGYGFERLHRKAAIPL
jgi:hypothetical protein